MTRWTRTGLFTAGGAVLGVGVAYVMQFLGTG
jgi:hypothetical protein